MAEKKAKKEKIPRQPMPEQEADVRRRNFDEVPFGYSKELAMKEAERCLQCKKPTCVTGCPVSIDIPGFVKLIKEGEFTKSIRKIWEKNSLPAVCGRVCPQEDQCEGVCILAKKEEPVAIGNLERFVADLEREHGTGELPPKAAPTGKRVAVVGSGPSGLTVAGDLILKGHDVTVFEAFHKPGGVLVYGIPEFRLPKKILEAEVNYLKSLGVELITNFVVGLTATIDDLKKEGYEAFFIGTGAGLPNFMRIPGENLVGVYSANEYLTRVNLMRAYDFPTYDTPVFLGKRVAVLGGGNVAMDSVRTAKRLGAELIALHVVQDERQKKGGEESLNIFSEAGEKAQVKVTKIQKKGDLVPTVIETAEQESAHLIIMGTSRGKVVAEWVSADAMSKTTIPVLVVPREFRDPGQSPGLVE